MAVVSPEGLIIPTLPALLSLAGVVGGALIIRNMTASVAAKGYHYQFVFARNAGLPLLIIPYLLWSLRLRARD